MKRKIEVQDLAEVIELELDEVNEAIDTAARVFTDPEVTAYLRVKQFTPTGPIEDEEVYLNAFLEGRERMIGIPKNKKPRR